MKILAYSKNLKENEIVDVKTDPFVDMANQQINPHVPLIHDKMMPFLKNINYQVYCITCETPLFTRDDIIGFDFQFNVIVDCDAVENLKEGKTYCCSECGLTLTPTTTDPDLNPIFLFKFLNLRSWYDLIGLTLTEDEDFSSNYSI